MALTNILAVVVVSDMDAALSWYEILLGRPPDRIPMDGCAEWQLTATGGLQVVRDPDHAGSSFLTLGVDDLESHIAELEERDLLSGPITEGRMDTGETIRISRISDPEGNVITFGEEPEMRPVKM